LLQQKTPASRGAGERRARSAAGPNKQVKLAGGRKLRAGVDSLGLAKLLKREEGKMFFFEKKNQKTFVCFARQ
jgi:hypothetical protein